MEIIHHNTSMTKKITWFVFLFSLFTLTVFGIYRTIFLHQFSDTTANFYKIILYGIRLDIGLIGFEFFSMAIIAILIGRWSLRINLLLAWILTFFHIAYAFANLQFFAERNQQIGESFAAYLTSPYEIYIAVHPVASNHPILASLVLLLCIGFFYTGVRYSRRYSLDVVLVWKSPKNLVIVILLGLIAWIPCWDIVTVKKVKKPSGMQIRVLHSKYYAQFDHFILNQSVINPWFDLFRIHIPESLKKQVPYRLTQAEAIDLAKSNLGIVSTQLEYPLLRRLPKQTYPFVLENVVILQIEGLSQSLIAKEENGKPVMPYLAKLSKEGFYFPNGVQGFTATIGSFFATATSIHKACFDEKTKTLTSDEMNGYFGCLSRILGPEYVHYFGQAYRQNYNDFIYFMGNQGYISMSYYDFKARLEKKQLLDVADDVQGIFDGYFLDECAEILVASSQKYTAHFVTVTSHSPWTVPKTFPAPFAEPYLTAFAYVDHCIQSFMERLMSQPERFAKTLVVIVADHTSVVFSNDLWERIRIPIIFYNPQFATFPKPDHCLNIYASHVDVMPTVIALLGGDLPYAGLGKNLLDPASVKIGAVGGSRTDGFYVKDKFLLQYSPWDKEAQLFILHEGRCELKDKSEEYPGIKQEMMLEYLAQYESARRLASQNLIFPREKK